MWIRSRVARQHCRQRLPVSFALQIAYGSRKLSRCESLNHEVIRTDDFAAGHQALMVGCVAQLRGPLQGIILGFANGRSNPGEPFGRQHPVVPCAFNLGRFDVDLYGLAKTLRTLLRRHQLCHIQTPAAQGRTGEYQAGARAVLLLNQV